MITFSEKLPRSRTQAKMLFKINTVYKNWYIILSIFFYSFILFRTVYSYNTKMSSPNQVEMNL